MKACSWTQGHKSKALMFDVEHSVWAECLIEHLIRTKYSTSNIQPGLNVLIEHSVWAECSIEHSARNEKFNIEH